MMKATNRGSVVSNKRPVLSVDMVNASVNMPLSAAKNRPLKSSFTTSCRPREEKTQATILPQVARMMQRAANHNEGAKENRINPKP
jgi:hypothetical protein